MILTSGRQGFVRWHPGYPRSDAAYTHMLLAVAIKPEQSSVGMFNHPQDRNDRCQPLCQFEIE